MSSAHPLTVPNILPKFYESLSRGKGDMELTFKETKSATMNIFRFFLFSF